jgi:hypothetical protein
VTALRSIAFESILKHLDEDHIYGGLPPVYNRAECPDATELPSGKKGVARENHGRTRNLYARITVYKR